MEERGVAPQPLGTDFVPSSALLQLGGAYSECQRGERGLHLGSGIGSRQTRRAQRGNGLALAALREPTPSRMLIVSSLPPGGQTGSEPPGEATDGSPDQ